MGLDMYLKGKRYLSQYNDQDKPIAEDLTNKFFSKKLTDIANADNEPIRINQLECSLAYWRKANAIHNWFVENCQDGVDECQESYVTRDKLSELMGICKQILDDNSLAAELLPPQSGFFFGSTDIDEWYMQNIEFTHDRIKLILESDEFDGWDFYYHSSW